MSINRDEFRFNCPVCAQHYIAPLSMIGDFTVCRSCKTNVCIEPRGCFFDDLNLKQKRAVAEIDGIIRVTAGAGTGKTRVLIHRLAYLVKEIGIPESTILSVTFTNKAAGVMRERAKKLLGENTASRISTFHGFAHEILKEDMVHLNWSPNFSIMDNEDQKYLIKEIFNEHKIQSTVFTIKDALTEIRRTKNASMFDYTKYLTVPEFRNAQDFISDPQKTPKKIVVNEYLRKQRKYFCLDFDDLIIFAICLLSTNPEIKEKWNERINYIQVDEFQDVNVTQFDFLSLLIGENKNLFAVGDPDQSIYAFRGARQGIFLQLDQFADNIKANFTDLVLDDNYRSTQNILDCSNRMIAYNDDRIVKNLQAVKGAGHKKPVFFHAANSIKECEWICDQILEIKKYHKFEDIAVLLRSSSHSRPIESAFIKKAVPYRIINGVKFFSRKEIKDCLSYLRLVERNDDLSFLRIINTPPRGIGKTRIDFLKKYAAEHNISLFEALEKNAGQGLFGRRTVKPGMPKPPADGNYLPLYPDEFVRMIKVLRKKSETATVSDLLADVLRESGYDAWVMQSGDDEDKENILELKAGIVEQEKYFEEKISLNDYLNYIAINAEKAENCEKDQVRIMTIHAAKGMEFPLVFVPFFNERILPSRKAATPLDIREERRIAYVALTRAEKQLFLSNSEGNERDHFLKPSRFLLEIGNKLLNVAGIADPGYWNYSPGSSNVVKKTEIRLGDKIICFWGRGTVEKISDGVFLIKLDDGRRKKITADGIEIISSHQEENI